MARLLLVITVGALHAEKTAMHSLRWLAALAPLLLATPASADQFYGERIPVSEGGTLRIVLDRGDVEVTSHDAPEVRIEALARGLGASSMAFQVRVDGREVLLTGRDAAWLAWISGGPHVNVRVWVPRRFTVEVATAGRIAARGAHHIASPTRNTSP